MKRQDKFEHFAREYTTTREQMEHQMAKVEGNQFVKATLALQYAIVSLRSQNMTPSAIRDLVETLQAPDKSIN